jgi:uncharacterized protein involved in oxidation of intracellular sulfur
MNILFIISTDDTETAYNAMRLANVAVNKGNEVSVFMLGKGVLYEKNSTEQFNVMEQVNHFRHGPGQILPKRWVLQAKANQKILPG